MVDENNYSNHVVDESNYFRTYSREWAPLLPGGA